MKRAAALALIVLAAHAAPAAARAGTEAGLYVGETVWGTPACGQPHVEVSTPGSYLQAHGTGAFDGAEPEAWADEDRCAIILNPRYKIHTAAKRCHVIVHEYGHLAGYRDPTNSADPTHSDNPRSVMYGEDLVGEALMPYGKNGNKRRWEAAGAFRPCVTMTAPGVQVG